MCVCVYTFDQVEENLLPPIEDHFSRSFDESFIRHVVTSVNYPPPSPRIESRASPQASKGFNTVPVILHKPVHLTLLLTAKNEAGEKDCLVTWPGVCLSYTRFQQIAAPPPSTNTSLDCCLSKRRTSRISARLTGRHYLRYRWIANYRLNRKYDYVSRCIILEYMYVITREKLQILLLCKNGKNEVRIKLLTFQRTFNYFSSSKGITIINIFHSFSNRCNQIKFITEVRIRISIQSFYKIIIYLKKEK